jgi:hypothetical protein
MKETNESGFRGRTERRILGGRVIAVDTTLHQATLDVSAYDALGNPIYYFVNYNPTTVPKIGDTIQIAYGNSSPHSGIIGGNVVGGSNQGQVVDNGGVSSVDGLSGDINLVAGTNISIGVAGQNITITNTGGGGGGIAPLGGMVKKTANYSVGAGDFLILCNTFSFTVTLPAASANANRIIAVRNDSGGGTAITVAPTGGDTIDVTSILATANPSTVWYMSDGISRWVAIVKSA